jgi:hypothetical protein
LEATSLPVQQPSRTKLPRAFPPDFGTTLRGTRPNHVLQRRPSLASNV